MKKEFVMRGQTASGQTEVLNFSGYKPGYAYRLTEFQIYPSTNIGDQNFEMCASITAAKTAVAPTDVNFNDEGLLATVLITGSTSIGNSMVEYGVVNDTFLITQNLILMMQDTVASKPTNWQIRFVAEKMSGPEEAVANYRQYTISDD